MLIYENCVIEVSGLYADNFRSNLTVEEYQREGGAISNCLFPMMCSKSMEK